MTPAPPPARQRFNPRGRAAALPPSYTTTGDTTQVQAPTSAPDVTGTLLITSLFWSPTETEMRKAPAPP